MGQWQSWCQPVRICIHGKHPCNMEEGSPGSRTCTQQGYIFFSQQEWVLLIVSVMRKTKSQLLTDVGATVTCKVWSIHALPKYTPSLWDPHNLRTLFKELSLRKISELLKKTRLKFIRVFMWVNCLGQRDLPRWNTVQLLPDHCRKWTRGSGGHRESGVQMDPISWCEMQCPKTHTKEFWKVVLVQPGFLST